MTDANIGTNKIETEHKMYTDQESNRKLSLQIAQTIAQKITESKTSSKNLFEISF